MVAGRGDGQGGGHRRAAKPPQGGKVKRNRRERRRLVGAASCAVGWAAVSSFAASTASANWFSASSPRVGANAWGGVLLRRRQLQLRLRQALLSLSVESAQCGVVQRRGGDCA